MPETPNTADRMVGLLVIVATLATIGVNALAALGLINGVTPADYLRAAPVADNAGRLCLLDLEPDLSVARGVQHLPTGISANIRRFKIYAGCISRVAALNCRVAVVLASRADRYLFLVDHWVGRALFEHRWRLTRPMFLVDGF